VKEVLQAQDVATRNELIAAHLRQMEKALEQTQRTVASLRALLERPDQPPISVEYRSVPATLALTIGEPVAMADVGDWWAGAFDELHGILGSVGAHRSGPDAALYRSEFFEAERGEVVAFVPVAGTPATAISGRARLARIPAAELAVTVYQGAFAEIDQAYGALGTFVAEREIGVQGPIREYYIAGTGDESEQRTEVCWPVFRTRGDR
jgi:effector-binding domain-containing protein